MPKPKYQVVMSEQTLANINQYKEQLISGQAQPGAYLDEKIKETGKSLQNLKTDEFVEILLSTKKPKIFAESAIEGEGKDWNNQELKILGDINITVPTKIYDNGVWNPKSSAFKTHDKPLKGELLFTPGALLKSGPMFNGQTPDMAEVVGTDGKIDQVAYNALVERRLFPLLVHANDQAGKDGKPALVTMPGIGAGEFAGKFKGEMGTHLDIAMQAMLEKHGNKLGNIKAIHFDPFDEVDNKQQNFGNLTYKVRPQYKDNEGKSQLSNPTNLQDPGEDFSKCKIYKMVAWDHVSLPGNDYFQGLRKTDDGVAAAATNSMKAITGVKGKYNKETGRYDPPPGEDYANWEEVANKKGVHLVAQNNIKIISNEGKSYSLNEFEMKQHQVGNIEVLREFKNSNYDIIKDLYKPNDPNKKGLDRDEVLYFDLAIEKGKEGIVYASKNDFNLEEYKQVKKYYKDAQGNFHDYNNGEELKEYSKKITEIAQSMSNTYGNNTYSKTFKLEIEADLTKLNVKLNRLGREPQEENFDKAKRELAAQINDNIRADLRELQKDHQFNENGNQELQDKLKKLCTPIEWKNEQAVKHADSIRLLLQDTSLNDPIKKSISEFLEQLDKDNQAILKGDKKESNFIFLAETLLKDNKFQDSTNLEYKSKLQDLVNVSKSADNFSKEAQNFVQTCKTQGLLNGNTPLATTLKAVDYKLEQNIYPLINKTFSEYPYHKALSTLQESLQKYQEIEARLKLQPTITYTKDVTKENKEKNPEHADYIKAIAKMLIDQYQFTGLNPNDRNFAENLKAFDPKQLKKLEISFNHDTGTSTESKIYKISPENFIKIMQNLDPKLIRNMHNKGDMDVKGNWEYSEIKSVRALIDTQLKEAGFTKDMLASSFVQRNEAKIEKEIEKVKRKSLEGLTTQKVEEKVPLAIPANKLSFPKDVREMAEQKATIDLKDIETRSKPLPFNPKQKTAKPLPPRPDTRPTRPLPPIPNQTLNSASVKNAEQPSPPNIPPPPTELPPPLPKDVVHSVPGHNPLSMPPTDIPPPPKDVSSPPLNNKALEALKDKVKKTLEKHGVESTQGIADDWDEVPSKPKPSEYKPSKSELDNLIKQTQETISGVKSSSVKGADEQVTSTITRKEIIGVHRQNKPTPEVISNQDKQIITTTPPQPPAQNVTAVPAKSNIEPQSLTHDQQIKNLKQKLGQKLQNTLSKIGKALRTGGMHQSASQENNSSVPKTLKESNDKSPSK